MALESVSLVNFQSLPTATIDFPETGVVVIVGPSSLGKSAITRAIRLLARNGPATGLVRQGATKLTVQAVTESGCIEIVKGAKVSEFHIDGEVYAKTGVKAPEQAENFWKIPAPDGKEIAFSSQHDPPFLLAEPASAVAKVLGDLTNASLLMEAVQKANRLRQEALNDHKARTREAEESREQLAAYHDLPERRGRLSVLGVLVYEAKEAQEDYDHLAKLLAEQAKLAKFIAGATQYLSKSRGDADKLAEAERLVALVAELTEATQVVATTTRHLHRVQEQHKQTTDQMHQLLEQAGTCPLCGSETK